MPSPILMVKKGVMLGRNVPSWVTRSAEGIPATLDYDFQNARWFYNKRSYWSEAALLAALNGSSSGITRTIGPYVSGPELLSNGTFDTNTTGWAASNGGAIASVSGQCVLTANGNLSCFSQGVAAGQGEAFRLAGTGNKGTSANTFSAVAAPNADLSSGVAGAAMSNVSPTPFTLYSGRLADTTYFGVRNNSATGTGTHIFDDFSVKRAVPFLGWTVPAVTAVIKGKTPIGQSANQIAWQADANSERDRIRLRRNSSDGHFVLIVTVNNATQAQLDLGAIADDTAFSVAITCAQNSFSASLNGGAPVTDTSGDLPGTCFMRIGVDSVGGATVWGGEIHRVTVL